MRAGSGPGHRPAGVRRADSVPSLVLALMLVLQSGCVLWPTMRQPSIELSVVDAADRPVTDAPVQVAAYSVTMAQTSQVTRFTTDASGRLSLPSRREFDVIILAPDGATFYSWSWCAERPGHHVVVGSDLRAHPERPTATVRLEPSVRSERCVWQSRQRRFEVTTD